MNGGNVVPLRFQTFDELERTEREIHAEHYNAWHKAYRQYDMTIAIAENDEAALAKFDEPTELAKAKAEAIRLQEKHGDLAKVYVLAALVATLKELIAKRDGQLFGHGAVAKRSLRFARSNPDKFYGPAASSLPPSA